MAVRPSDGNCRICGAALAASMRDGRCAKCGAPVPPDVRQAGAALGRLTNFGCGVAGWATGFLIGLSVSYCHMHAVGTLRQRHVLAPLITALAGALLYGLVARALDPRLRPDFELLAVAGIAGTAAAAFASALRPCSGPLLVLVALPVALAASALLAPSFFARPGSSGAR